MAQKKVIIDGIGEVTLARRQGSRSLRLSVNSSGRIRVGLPYWIPYRTAIRFAQQRKEWITKHQLLNKHIVLTNQLKIGKSHRLYFHYDTNLKAIRTRIDKIGIHVRSPYEEQDTRVQAKARLACERALAREAGTLLPQRLDSLSKSYGYQYKGVRIRKLTSRWGSCSSDGFITLSYFLMQLPWELIDYVIVHELVHTKHPNHGPGFWHDMEKFSPEAKRLQKQIRSHKPRVEPWRDLIQTPPSVSIDSNGLL